MILKVVFINSGAIDLSILEQLSVSAGCREQRVVSDENLKIFLPSQSRTFDRKNGTRDSIRSNTDSSVEAMTLMKEELAGFVGTISKHLCN